MHLSSGRYEVSLGATAVLRIIRMAPIQQKLALIFGFWLNSTLGLKGDNVPIVALAYTRDSQSLISNGHRQIAVRSPQTGNVILTHPCDQSKITCLVFNSNSSVLAIGGGQPNETGILRVWRWPQAKELARLNAHKDLVQSVAFEDSGKIIATASADHSIKLWNCENLENPKLLQTLTGHSAPVLAMAFMHQTGQIISAGVDRSIKVWSITDGSIVRSLNYHTEAVHALVMKPFLAESPELQPLCVTTGADRTIRVWQPGIGRMVRIIRGLPTPGLGLAMSKSGDRIFVVDCSGTLRIYDGSSDQLIGDNQLHQDWIYSIAISPDGRSIATGDASGQLKITAVSDLSSEPRSK